MCVLDFHMWSAAFLPPPLITGIMHAEAPYVPDHTSIDSNLMKMQTKCPAEDLRDTGTGRGLPAGSVSRLRDVP